MAPSRGTGDMVSTKENRGGPDSMALACLFQQLSRRGGARPSFDLTALVVDHNHRTDSRKEAETVSTWLQDLGIRSKILTLRWPRDQDPALLGNFETHARRLRYRRLACGCLSEDLEALFLGHHLTDQVETIIQRLLRNQQAGLAGLSGMRPVNDIPCCSDVYGASDGLEASPLSTLLGNTSFGMGRNPGSPTLRDIVGYRDYLASSHAAAGFDSPSSPLQTPQPLESVSGPSPTTEDGPFSDRILISHPGIQIYRPLLAFPKTRLLATCQSNGVPFVADPSNTEPTTTQRNAIRWLVSNKRLPKALQQDSILRLGATSAQMADARNKKVIALMNATQLKSFDLRSSRLVILVPMDICEMFNASDQEAAHYLSRLLELVSPEQRNPESPLSLISTVRYMFPELHNPSRKSPSPSPPGPHSRTARGVLIEPLPCHPPGRSWSMTRRPFTSQEKPEQTFSPAAPDGRGMNREWSQWLRFDGRYWLRIRTQNPQHVSRFRVRELRQSDMQALNAMHQHQRRPDPGAPPPPLRSLPALLRDAAPGKLRYTLPVLVRGDRVRAFPTLHLHMPAPAGPGPVHHATTHMAADGDGLQWEVRYKSVGESLKYLDTSGCVHGAIA